MEEIEQKPLKRNIYDDNIKDIKNIVDLENLDAFYSINVLENNDNSISFEYGNDFWKYNKQTKDLHQHTDFVSLKEGVGEKVNNKDYGQIILEEINSNKQIENLPQFKLEERQEYVVEQGKVVNGAFQITPEILNKKRTNVKNNSDRLTKNFETQEMKSQIDLIKSAIDILALSYFIVKDKVDKRKKEKFVRLIVDGLDNNTIDINKVLEDRDLLNKLPELKDVLKRYEKQKIQSTNITKEASLLLEDDKINEIAQKLAGEDEYVNALFSSIENQFDKSIDQEDIKIFKELYNNSNQENSFEFTKGFIQENLDDFAIKNGNANKDISPDELGVAMVFLSNKIDKNEVDKKLLAEKVGEIKLGEEGLSNAKAENIVNIVTKVFTKIKELNKSEEQTLKKS